MARTWEAHIIARPKHFKCLIRATVIFESDTDEDAAELADAYASRLGQYDAADVDSLQEVTPPFRPLNSFQRDQARLADKARDPNRTHWPAEPEICGARPYPAGSEGDDGTECQLPAGHAGHHDDMPAHVSNDQCPDCHTPDRRRHYIGCPALDPQ